MTGVHLDARYRDAVIDELYEHPHRYSAPSGDVDTVAVLTEALHARRTALRWSVPMALLWALGFLVTGPLFAVYAAGCAALFGAAALRRRARRARRTVALATAAVLRVVGYAALVGYAAPAVAKAGDSVWPWTTAAFGVPALMAGVAGAHRMAVGRRLRADGPPRQRPPTRISHLRIAALIAAEQASPVVFHRDRSPFLGSGPVRDTWALTTEVRGRIGVFAPPEVLARLSHAVRQVPGLADQVGEYLPFPEEMAPPRGVSLERFQGLSDNARWLRIVSEASGPHPTTVFVRVRLDGPFLSVQQVTCAMPPVRHDFAHVLRLPSAYRARPLSRAPARFPLTSAALLAEAAAWPVRRARLLFSPPERPSAPRLSLREAAAEPDLPPLAAADADRVSRTVRLLVLDAVREALREHGLSTTDPADSQQESFGVHGGGIHIGNMTGGVVATGSHGRASGITRHTSPGPTTNPDDDSWEDDLG